MESDSYIRKGISYESVLEHSVMETPSFSDFYHFPTKAIRCEFATSLMNNFRCYVNQFQSDHLNQFQFQY